MHTTQLFEPGERIVLIAADMTDGKKTRFTLYIEQELLEGLDDIRKDQPGLPSRAEVIRRLIKKEMAEKAAAKLAKPKG